jgi:hypothetical protein
MTQRLRIHETLKCRHSCLEVVYRVNVGVCTAHRSVSLEATFGVATLLSQCNRPWCEQCSFNVSRHDLAVPASWKFIPTHTTYIITKAEWQSVVWTKEKTKSLIEMLEGSPELWDTSSPLYRDRTKKNAAVGKFAEHFQSCITYERK